MPVKTSIAATGAIFVLHAIMETKTDYTRRSIPSTEPFEQLCLDWKTKLLFGNFWHEKRSPVRSSCSDQGAPGVPGSYGAPKTKGKRKRRSISTTLATRTLPLEDYMRGYRCLLLFLTIILHCETEN